MEESRFVNDVLLTIVKITDFTDPNNKKRLAVCFGAVYIRSSLGVYLNSGCADDDNHRSFIQMVYNSMPLIYHYSALAMLAPNWLTFSRFWKLCAFIYFVKLVTTM